METGTATETRTMNQPAWVDESLSTALPILRSRGEGQATEYISKFPDQARELGKEIAAFSTSNDGIILIGVGDDGDIVGVPDLHA